MQEVGFDLITGQVTASGTAAPLTSDTTLRCERLHLRNPGATVVYIGKAGVTTSTGYGIDNTMHDLCVEYSGFIADVYCVTSGSQVIHWMAVR